jgi:RNA polymerase sigma factor (sigma-70 family)
VEGELLIPQLMREPAFSISTEKVPHAEILARARRGDAHAFTDLFQVYHARIFTYLVHIVGRREEAEDLAQETFIKAWRSLDMLHDDARFSSWLYRVATSTALDYLRGQKKRKYLWQLDEVSLDQEDEQSSHFAEQVAEEEHIQETLRRVPRQYRICLLLYYEVGYTQREIALLLKMSDKNVNVYIRRGCEHFRHIYQALEKGSGSTRGRRSSR